MGKYDDIIYLSHNISIKHPRMTVEQRSVQFAPFAALTGYDGQVTETARLTDDKLDINDDAKFILNLKMEILKKNINAKPKIEITYFIKDSRKSGGKYVKCENTVKGIDDYRKVLKMIDGTTIPIDDIIDIDGEIINV